MDAEHEMKIDLQRGISADEIEVHYQPIVAIDNCRKVAAEALVRWRHPDRGLIFPDAFIPFAETSGLIDQLGQYVLRQACVDACQWPEFTKVAVNLSAVQFQNPDLVGSIARILTDTGLPPERLELEITESVLLTSSVENIEMLHELHDIGVSIALDDFGTGYSSLSYLRAFAFDKIKIDRSFVSEMPHMDVCAAIVCAVANLGRSIEITTTAEGVETEQQFDLLRAAGCTHAQGYLFGKPLPVEYLDFETSVAPFTRTASQSALTPRDIMLVRNSFALVAPLQDGVAMLFYDRLFALAPKLRPLFSTDLSDQKRKLMTVLTTCIGKLHDMSSLTSVLRDLGARHVGYGTRPEHYMLVADALLWTLRKGLGERFTPEIRAAWTKVYGVLAATMLEGAAEVGRRRSVG